MTTRKDQQGSEPAERETTDAGQDQFIGMDDPRWMKRTQEELDKHLLEVWEQTGAMPRQRRA